MIICKRKLLISSLIKLLLRSRHSSVKELNNYCVFITNSTTSFHTNCNYQSTRSLSSNYNYRAVFLGSDAFSIPSLVMTTHLLGSTNVSVVVSNFGNEVAKFAKKNELETFHWEDFKTRDFWKLNNRSEEFGVVASFGHLIPLQVIERFPLGILNVHGSLLPRWRGAAPIPHAIIHGDKTTGISIMQIAPHKFDVGPILYQQEIPIHPHIRRPELISILADVGAEALGHVISDIDHFTAHPIPQNEEEAKVSPKLTPEMANVDWDTKTADEVYNLFRGLYGVFKLNTYLIEKPIDLDEIGLVVMNSNRDSDSGSGKCEQNNPSLNRTTNFETFYSNSPFYNLDNINVLHSSVPGQIIFYKDIILVKCMDVSNSLKYMQYVSVRKFKIGKKWMSAKDFQNGFLSKCTPDQRIFSFQQQTNSVQTENIMKKQQEQKLK